jgi:hypothetical protein
VQAHRTGSLLGSQYTGGWPLTAARVSVLSTRTIIVRFQHFQPELHNQRTAPAVDSCRVHRHARVVGEPAGRESRV